MKAFGYTRLELTERELGAGLIIEAGLKAAKPPARPSCAADPLIWEARSIEARTVSRLRRCHVS